MANIYCLSNVSDTVLERELITLNEEERGTTAQILAHVAEVDARELYLARACSSTYKYLVEELHMSEDVAFNRLKVARAARKFPVIFDLIAKGELHVSGVKVMCEFLTKENHEALIEAARNRTKRSIELMVAIHFPRPDVPDLVRVQPELRTLEPTRDVPCPEPDCCTKEAELMFLGSRELMEVPVAPKEYDVEEPLSKTRYRIEFTASQALQQKLERLEALLRHENPKGGLEYVIERACDRLLEEKLKEKFGQTDAPQKAKPAKSGEEVSRHVPHDVRRDVHARDGERCAFVDERGKQCTERGFLEFQHEEPWALAGHKHRADEIALYCRAHNQHAAKLDFGADFVEQKKQERRADRSKYEPELAADSADQTETEDVKVNPPRPGTENTSVRAMGVLPRL